MTSAAYNDVLANQLDFTDIIPSDRLVGDLYKTELDGSQSPARDRHHLGHRRTRPTTRR